MRRWKAERCRGTNVMDAGDGGDDDDDSDDNDSDDDDSDDDDSDAYIPAPHAGDDTSDTDDEESDDADDVDITSSEVPSGILEFCSKYNYGHLSQLAHWVTN